MAEMTDRYQGIEVFGNDGAKMGEVIGFLTDDALHQFYVVQTAGFLGFGQKRYYIPADLGIVTGSRRLDVDAAWEDIERLGWNLDPSVRGADARAA